MGLCYLEGFNETQADRFHQLIADQTLNINCVKIKSNPLVLLCQNNRSARLYPALKAFLQRDDFKINSISPSGYNCLMFLCRFYSHPNLINCVQLLVDKGIDLEARESKKQLSALQILCANYSGENLIDVALCLIHRTTKYKNIKKCVDILLQRKLLSQSQTLENILGHIRSGRNPVITSSRFTFLNH